MTETEPRGRRPDPRVRDVTVDAQRIAAQAAAATKRPPRRPQLLVKWTDIASWQQDNHFIRTGYRPSTGSMNECFQSLFYLHNESVNIHSHLAGAFLFFSIAVSIFLFEQDRLDSADIMVLSCFFGSAVLCLSISAVYHLISNHSAGVARLGNQLDYVGIVALITGSFVPSIYYGFYCDLFLKRIYWSMVCRSSDRRVSAGHSHLGSKIFIPDLFLRYYLYYRFFENEVSDTEVATFPSLHVHGHGPECDFACRTRITPLW